MCTLPSHGFAADADGAPQPSHPFYAISLRSFNRSVKGPLLPSWATARLMARITWQLLTQRRAYTSRH